MVTVMYRFYTSHAETGRYNTYIFNLLIFSFASNYFVIENRFQYSWQLHCDWVTTEQIS